MRTLYEIVEGAKDGVRPTEEESYHAMLALSSLLNGTFMEYSRVVPDNDEELENNLTFINFKEALNIDPKSYLGKDIPGNPEYDEFRRWGHALLNNIFNEED